jgi:hypothetical protein
MADPSRGLEARTVPASENNFVEMLPPEGGVFGTVYGPDRTRGQG